MESFAQFALYVSSIVLAVGIGMFRSEGTEKYSMEGDDSDCQQGVKSNGCRGFGYVWRVRHL